MSINFNDLGFFLLSKEQKEQIAKCYHVEQVITVRGTDFIVMPLLYHYALLVEPNLTGYEQRYCYANLSLISKALREYDDDGVLKYWHKDHTKGLSVSCGNLLFEPGVLHQKGLEVGEVSWSVE